MATRTTSKPASQTRPGSPAASALRLHVLAGAVLIVLATSLAYAPSLSGGFILDDNLLLTENPLIKASDGLYRFWCTTEPIDYWPVFNTTLWLEWRFWGMHPTGYHVTNLVLHIATAMLMWAVLQRLSIPGAFLAATLFAVHPVNAESVAWITQRKNLLAMLFFLLSILWYLKAESAWPSQRRRSPDVPTKAKTALRLAQGERTHASKSDRQPLVLSSSKHDSGEHRQFPPQVANPWYWLSLAGFVLAMLSKGSVAVLPLLLLGIIWCLRPLARRDVVRTAPFFLVGVGLVLVNVWFQARFTKADLEATGFTERLLGAAAVVWFYLYKALLPVNLSFVYPKWHIRADQLQWWLPLLAAVAVTSVLWWYRRSWSRPLLLAWGYVCVSLAPVMGFTSVGFMEHSLVADHYQHVALIGMMALVAAGWGTWQQRARGPARWVPNAVAVAVGGTLAVLTWQQSGLYVNGMTLYRDTLRKNPGSAFAHNNLGLVLLDAGRPAEASEEFEKAVQLKPDFPEAHYNLARILSQAGRFQEAIGQYQQALQGRPDYPEYHYDLGTALVHARQLQEGIEHFQQALHLRPDYAEAHNNLGGVLFETGRPQEAIEQYEQALRLNPDFPAAHSNLGRALLHGGRLQEAIEHFQQALQLTPDSPEAHNDLGVALTDAGRVQEAIGHFQQALQLKPDYSNARNNLQEAQAMEQKAAERRQ